MRFALVLLVVIGWVWFASTGSTATLIYQTGFEFSEGYRTNTDLAGQQGWLQEGSGGNGILTGYFSGKGQQAYIGFAPPASTNEYSLFLYHPLNKKLSHVQFSVKMAISYSSNQNFDDFFWSLYNQDITNLVALDFDNYTLEVYYWLQGATNRTRTGLTFTNGPAYPLTMDLDFANNRWSATFNGQLLATNQPLTTTNSALNLGDIDAEWEVYDPAAPGDNYMVFDDYLVTATLVPTRLQWLGTLSDAPVLQLSGEPDNNFAIDASTNLTSWVPLKTNTTTGGYFDYVDVTATNVPARYYRGRWLSN